VGVCRQACLRATRRSDTGIYNPVGHSIQWVGSPGSCCADPSAFQLLRYDVDGDSWTVHETPWPDHSGHAYDGNAVDPSTGIHYFAHSDDVQGFDGEHCTPTGELPIYTPIAAAATWVPELSSGDGGLVYVGGRHDVAWFDGEVWNELTAPGEGWGGYHVFAEYNPVHQVTWLGAGVEGSTSHYELDASLEFRELSAAPVGLDSDGRAFKTYDPISGLFIVYRPEEETWHEYDIVSDSWNDITASMNESLPPTWSSSGHRFFVPIDDCRVIYVYIHQADNRRAYVYRHSDV
jgi:hypothetical protein